MSYLFELRQHLQYACDIFDLIFKMHVCESTPLIFNMCNTNLIWLSYILYCDSPQNYVLLQGSKSQFQI